MGTVTSVRGLFRPPVRSTVVRRSGCEQGDLKMRGVGGKDGKKMRVVTRVVGHVGSLEAERSDAGGERRRG